MQNLFMTLRKSSSYPKAHFLFIFLIAHFYSYFHSFVSTHSFIFPLRESSRNFVSTFSFYISKLDILWRGPRNFFALSATVTAGLHPEVLELQPVPTLRTYFRVGSMDRGFGNLKASRAGNRKI